MSKLLTVLVFSFVGVLGARHPAVDINRIKRLPTEELVGTFPTYYQNPNLDWEQRRKSNDYDDHNTRSTLSRATVQLQAPASTGDKEKTITVHQPREDPKLFYQSDSYLKKYIPINMKNEVSEIYPGREVVRLGELPRYTSHNPVKLSMKHSSPLRESRHCIKCPRDRLVVARRESPGALLQAPRLRSCRGRRASRSVHFVPMYGPKFGALLDQGSHVVMGKIVYKGKTLQMCKMQVDVVVQNCPIPKYLTAECDEDHKTCNFSCRDKRSEMHGPQVSSCGDDMKWDGDLPKCKTRNWCEIPAPPKHGHISCKGDPREDAGGEAASLGLVDGAKCRVRCARGWRWRPRVAAVCRRGAWTHALSCQRKRTPSQSKRFV